MKMKNIRFLTSLIIGGLSLVYYMAGNAASNSIPVYGQLITDDSHDINELDNPDNPGESGSDEKPGDNSGGTKKPEDGEDEEKEIFMKVALEKEIFPGEEVQYLLQGFGNDIGREMKRYSLTDIFPEGLHFVSAQFPAFTNNQGIHYSVTYITNQNGRRILADGVAADKPYAVQDPELADGEWIMYLTIKISSAPEGFGVGDEILITCKVDEEPPQKQLINRAKMGFDGENKRPGEIGYSNVDSNTSRVNVKTGDRQKPEVLVMMMGICAGLVLLWYRGRKVRNGKGH